LTAQDMRAHNSLDQPHVLEPKPGDSLKSGSPVHYTFQPASVTRLEINLS
jgi:alpha-L-arabinofuranosidase